MAPRNSLIRLADGSTLSLHAPGLKQMRRGKGAISFYWVASSSAVKRGYSPKTVTLIQPRDHHDAEALAARCRDYSLQVDAWLDAPDHPRPVTFDGTVGSLIKLYQTHPESPFHDLARTSRSTYCDQLQVVENSVGARRLDRLVPIDTKRWYKGWAKPAQPGGAQRIRRAYGGIQMVRVLMSFGASLGIKDCARLHAGLGALRFQQPKPRDETMNAEDAERFIDAALAAGEIRIALGFACQFELTLRQSDVIGQWFDLKPDDPAGGIRHKQSVWRGLTFEQIDTKGVLRVVSSKTKVATSYDLAAYPMILKALAAVPGAERKGPMVTRGAGQPMDRWEYARTWRTLATRAGIAETVWNRDVRASGITEARDAGAALEDVSKTAGHTSVATTARIYDRSGVETSKRVQQSRVARRDAKKNGDT